jgi:Na+/proline symporter
MVGMGYSLGATCFWILPAGIIGYGLNWLVLAKPLRRKSQELDAVTVPEFIAASTGGTRSSRIAAALAAVLSVTFLLAYISAQFSAAGKTLSSHFDISYMFAVPVAAAFVTAYAVLGGFRAVSWTDNLQAVMMVFALLVLPAIAVCKLGGISSMWMALAVVDRRLVSITHGESGAAAISGVLAWIMLGLAYPGQPHAVSRLMAAKNDRLFTRASVIAIVWFIVIYSGAIILGMAARAGEAYLAAVPKDPEVILPTFATTLLPGLAAGLVLAAIFAAISSTADSMLIAVSTTVSHDMRAVVQRRPSSRELVLMRITIVLVAIVATVLSLREYPAVFQLVLYAW